MSQKRTYLLERHPRLAAVVIAVTVLVVLAMDGSRVVEARATMSGAAWSTGLLVGAALAAVAAVAGVAALAARVRPSKSVLVAATGIGGLAFLLTHPRRGGEVTEPLQLAVLIGVDALFALVMGVVAHRRWTAAPATSPAPA